MNKNTSKDATTPEPHGEEQTQAAQSEYADAAHVQHLESIVASIPKNKSDKSSKSISINVQLDQLDVLLLDFFAQQRGTKRSRLLAESIEDAVKEILFAIPDRSCILHLALGVDNMLTEQGYEHQHKTKPHSWLYEIDEIGIGREDGLLHNPDELVLWELMYNQRFNTGEGDK